jgi:ATP-dependent DNA helicase RecG
MILAQKRRFFPLPDYGQSTPDHVRLEIFGRTLDENYSLLLLERQEELTIDTVILLDRVQKRLPISDAAAARLRRDGLIEGRKPNYYVSARIADTTETQAAYTRNRGVDKPHLKQFVLSHLRQFKTTTREKLDALLTPMLPVGLTEEQKRNKVKNLLTEMRTKDHSIICEGKGPRATWRLEQNGLSDKAGI